MPTYEYECTSCGQHIEVFQRFSEDALTTCGVCEGTLRKVFHPVGIVFKGSGFYATDNRPKTGAGSTKDSDGGSPAASGSSESGSAPSESGPGKKDSKDSKDSKGSTGSKAGTKESSSS
jgi:putative FmdB family regulatory protein